MSFVRFDRASFVRFDRASFVRSFDSCVGSLVVGLFCSSGTERHLAEPSTAARLGLASARKRESVPSATYDARVE